MGNKPLRVLSLFDGLSGAQLALKSLGVKYEYYASEVDQYAIKVTQRAFPDTIQLGDVNDLDFSSLGLFDLIVAGSPCQGLSIANTMRQGLNDPRSRLFFKFVEAVKVIQPTYFLLENVASMSEDSKNTMSSHMGCEPVKINSSKMVGQMRNRYYWCNWSVDQPKDRVNTLNHILEDGYVNKAYSYCLDANYFKGTSLEHYRDKAVRQLVFETPEVIRDNFSIGADRAHTARGTRLTPTITYKNGCRKLTPVECERLQGVPDNYTDCVSNTQRYKMLGNGFTVPIIAHILKEGLDVE